MVRNEILISVEQKYLELNNVTVKSRWLWYVRHWILNKKLGLTALYCQKNRWLWYILHLLVNFMHLLVCLFNNLLIGFHFGGMIVSRITMSIWSEYSLCVASCAEDMWMDSARGWFQKLSSTKKDPMAGDGKPPSAEEASNITKQRVAAAKQYIEKHYKEQMKNLQERKERYDNRCYFCLTTSL